MILFTDFFLLILYLQWFHKVKIIYYINISENTFNKTVPKKNVTYELVIILIGDRSRIVKMNSQLLVADRLATLRGKICRIAVTS